jgi:putative copper export protein
VDVTLPDALSVALRAVSFLLLFQAAGLGLFDALFGHQLALSRPLIRRLGRRSALTAAACVLAHFALEPARLAGELSGMLDPSLLRTALGSSSGAAFIVRLVGLGLIALALRGDGARGADGRVLGLVGAALALFSFVLTGHTAASPARWWLRALLLVHLAVIAFWLGALPALGIVSRRAPPPALATALTDFSRLALWLVPMIFLAGLALALALVPGFAVLRQPYGEILLAKAAGFAVLMVFAAWNRHLTPAIASGRAAAVRALQRSLRIEYALIATVLALTALMTSLFSPT